MERLVEFEDGICLEIEETEDGTQRVARIPGVIEKANASFADAIGKIKPIAETMIAKLSNLSVKPDEIQVEFGVKIDGKFNTVVAGGGAEANFKISLKWSKPK